MINRDKIKYNRLLKAEKLRTQGIDPYPSQVKKTHDISRALTNFFDLSQSEKEIILVGRIMSLRSHGGSIFIDIQDGTGRIQIFAGRNTLGPKQFDFLKDNFDLGDFIQVNGILFTTKAGAKTLKAEKISMAAKSLFPLPSEWYGIKDPELRYRQRYIDLLLNDEIKKIFETRSHLVKLIRSFLDKEGFLEVETPILQNQYGGAKAKPFQTHLNALDIDVFLRIAPELYLKRLLIGGFDKVYELSRNFRNEGIDRMHNPEFTMLEFYWAYIDYKDLMKFTERMFSFLIKSIYGKEEFDHDGQKLNFRKPWPRLDFCQLIQKETGINLSEVDEKTLMKKAGELGVDVPKGANKAEIADAIYKKYCRSKIWQPSFIIHHPMGFFPLAKESKKIPGYTENFQLVAAGWELINAFSEQNDPVKQREIFEAQENNFKMGFEEAQRMDEDFLTALEYGMPPAAGFGMGIDRLAALITNAHSLREIIFFPTTRPK
jgi:lysyl-tRNA synthetase, class II